MKGNECKLEKHGRKAGALPSQYTDERTRMKRFTISEYAELEALISEFGGDAVFRGQTKHYGPENAPSMNTSFSRAGCIPTLMLRWSHYARFILAALLGTPTSLQRLI
ncbi:hypothetical protein SuNHUV7_26120 (plasmid) [Pseudoseohaeicola sp. NH-UV-7]